jgi:outer membrane protein TolC
MEKVTFKSLAAGIVLFITFPLALQAQMADSTLVLGDLIQKVRTQNPELQSSYEGWRASKTRIPQEKALPDPVLGLNLMNLPVNSFAFDQQPMTGKQISLMQPFPFPGKLDLKGKIAESESEITHLQYQELQNQLIKKTRQAYYDLFYIDQAIATVTGNQALLQEFVEIAETRYSVGGGLQQDVMRAQVALSKMIDQELKLRQNRESMQAQINALINEPVDTPLGHPVVPEASQQTAKLDSLVARAERSSPLLAAWDTVVKRSGQQVDLALRDRYPDFSVGVAYTQRDELQNGMKGYDFVSAMFTIKIPLYNGKKQSQKVQQQRINRSAIEYGYQDVKNSVEQRLQQALSDARKNQRLIELYETGIIPQAEQSLESSLAGYQNDKVDFLSLLDSELSLFQFRLDYYRFLADYHKSIAALEALTGSEL